MFQILHYKSHIYDKIRDLLIYSCLTNVTYVTNGIGMEAGMIMVSLTVKCNSVRIPFVTVTTVSVIVYQGNNRSFKTRSGFGPLMKLLSLSNEIPRKTSDIW